MFPKYYCCHELVLVPLFFVIEGISTPLRLAVGIGRLNTLKKATIILIQRDLLLFQLL